MGLQVWQALGAHAMVCLLAETKQPGVCTDHTEHAAEGSRCSQAMKARDKCVKQTGTRCIPTLVNSRPRCSCTCNVALEAPATPEPALLASEPLLRTTT